MSNILSKDQLIEMRVELEAEVNEKQEAAAVAKFEVDFETTSNINAVLKQIDKSYKWTIKDAAFAINLYDNLSAQIMGVNFE